ncbi:photosystem II D1 protein carboxyl-terminal processing peptidase [Synechococcus sp. PROS-7-1]|uniref:S41 family peptidase n=1 Tax=Synechococcus sp. PROS-7-1 TaxID=1442556 RepID=UPI00164737F6|nr:S41 family peptidase [Synechococcus sp. PROS-7-1]QNI85478.1 photosystem II D1 protein carboxyl-terminal processing peptidase [Synechococcus sp. PROS-7-1]
MPTPRLSPEHPHRQGLLLILGAGGIAAAVAIAAPGLGLPSTTSSSITDSPKEVIDQVWQIVYRDYLDSTGNYSPERWTTLRRDLLTKSYAGTDESYEAIRGMLASLDDPYTRFLDPKEFKQMQIDTSGELTGVGIQITLDKDTKDIVVVSPIEGTPASKAGVQPKDVIVSIDGESTKGMTTEDAVKLIRGQEGSEVTLGLRRKGEVVIVPLKRARIEINAVESRLNSGSDGTKVGYIRLKQFNAKASREMRAAIRDLEKQGAQGFVLDLRSNPGGLLEASVDIARQWLDEGTIVSTKTRDGIQDVRRATGSAVTDRPVVVLVNEGSASASEILSGALQDNNRAVLVGQKTFGKGLVQSVRGLSDGSGLTVTIAKYLTPKGTDIHKNGIRPDVPVELSEEEIQSLTVEQLGTGKDSQYRAAETTLIKALRSPGQGQAYQPGSANLQSALQR